MIQKSHRSSGSLEQHVDSGTQLAVRADDAKARRRSVPAEVAFFRLLKLVPHQLHILGVDRTPLVVGESQRGRHLHENMK